tara:strand:+ start:522 stop:1577 length:1056 start_codon:yes stop_codon:yes gene_type:complete
MAKNHKIKIIMCINSMEKGGAEKQFLYIFNYLQMFYDVNIFLINKKGIKNLDKKIKKKIQVGYLKYLLFLLNQKPNIALFFLPKSYILFGLISLFFPKVKKIMFRRSLNYYQSNLFFKYIEIFLHKFTKYICSNSYAAKKELINYEKVKKEKIFILKNFIDKDEYHHSKVLKINKKYINFLCISNFINYKGHRLILETFKYLKTKMKWKIYFLGKKNNFDFNLVKSIAKKYNFDKNIHHIDRLSSNLQFPNIKFGLLFSKNESFPNAILEYLKLNLDVIAYNTGDIKKLMKKEGLIFNTRNPKVIAKKIDIYLSKKRKKLKTVELNKIIHPYQNKKLFLTLKNKIDNICVD